MNERGLLRLGLLARTATLRAVGPIDFVCRLASGRGHLPPLWLRRHAGPLAAYEGSARDTDEWIGRLGLVRDGDRVVDLGCGAGAMVEPLRRRIGARGTYVGLDVHGPSLSWASRHFGNDSRLTFDAVSACSPYGRRNAAPAKRLTLPLADRSVQFVLAKSLFTHLLEEEASAYLAEIRRLLEPGRAALVTAFLFEPGSRVDRGLSRYFQHSEPGRPVRWRRRDRPQAAVAFERSHFVALAQQAGLWSPWIGRGFLPGDDDVPRGQDLVLLGA